MAGGGKLCSPVLLMALLALFTTTYAARSHPTVQFINTELVSAFGVIGAYKPCCMCACTLIYPPELSRCACAGTWEGTCPSVCKNCSCDENNQCHCEDGFVLRDYECMANQCPFNGAGKETHKEI